MRSVSATSAASGHAAGPQLTLGARRQKTDLQVADTIGARSSSPAPSVRSQKAKQYRASLPVRTARLLQRSRTQTPSEAGVSDGSTSPAPAPATLLQDVVDIKTLLLQLKRVLQEPGEEHHSMSSETLDPLLAACAESPARGNGRRPPHTLPTAHTPHARNEPLPPDACAEMRRQIVYLQGQLEERDRLVRVLQQQMLRMAESHEPRPDDTCNVATQTDRLRPPMSTALTSSENSGLVSFHLGGARVRPSDQVAWLDCLLAICLLCSVNVLCLLHLLYQNATDGVFLVSDRDIEEYCYKYNWNEQASARKLPAYSEAQKTKRPVTNGTVKQCQCGARKVNGHTNGDQNEQTDKRTDVVKVNSNSRVGSKYLQALANNSENRRYVKRDSSLGERSDRKTNLYSSRSRSIENFHNSNYQLYSGNEPIRHAVIDENALMKHHTSYGDLYNGRISSKESVNGHRHSPSLTGHSTDTDYSSDGGYKSLPSSINCNSHSPKKVSGIPRRSMEQKFLTAKSVKASAI